MKMHAFGAAALLLATALPSLASNPREMASPDGEAHILDAAHFDPAMARRLVDGLREGGYVIYFRHFETGQDTPDYVEATLGQCATQRQLNATGARQAIEVRTAFQSLHFPVAKVLSSPFCRAWQSADLAFGGHEVVDGLKLPKAKSKEFSEAEKAAMAGTLYPLLAAKPPPHTNTVIVAHDDNLPTVGAPYPENQGEALVFKPDGSGFRLIMQIKPDAWPKLTEAL